MNSEKVHKVQRTASGSEGSPYGSMPHLVSGTAVLSLSFQSVKSARAAYDSLLAEADFRSRGGSKVSLSEKTVRVEITADDPVSLRASLNSYLRLMQIIKTLEKDTD